MEIEFYYLDGKEQKGPYKIDELKNVGLKPETLVWSETLDSWKPAKDVPELTALLKKLPPPPPIIDNSTHILNEISTSPKNEKTIVEDSNVKAWVTFKVVASIFILISVIGLISYGYISNKKSSLKKEILTKIDNITDGKTVIIDGEQSGVQGKLEDTNLSNKKSNKKKNKKDLVWIKFGKDSVQTDLSDLAIQTWQERDGLYSFFKCENGGFTIKKLTKLDDEGYDIETFYSNDMGYRVPEYTYGVTGWSYNEYGESNTYGNIKNYRPSVQKCYSKAFDFFTKEDKTGSYSPGKFVDITNFPDLRNEYFFMENAAPKRYSSSGHFSATWWSSDDHTANIYTDDYRVYYSSRGNHYELTPNQSRINKELFTILGVGLGLLIISLIVILISKPQFFRNLYLFGKRWKNEVYHDQVLFFNHSFFGNHTFTEIIGENVLKGFLKITDKGNTINLSYTNKELFYKIEKLDLDSLTLVSLKDGTIITFRRVGSKQKQVSNSNENISSDVNKNNNETTNN